MLLFMGSFPGFGCSLRVPSRSPDTKIVIKKYNRQGVGSVLVMVKSCMCLFIVHFLCHFYCVTEMYCVGLFSF